MSATAPEVARAEVLQSLERWEEAAELLARRVAEEPDDVHAWTELGRCHWRIGRSTHTGVPPDEDRMRQALDATAAALARDPGFVNALMVRAPVQRELGRPEESLETLREAVRVRPGFWGAHAELGRYSGRYALIGWAKERRGTALETGDLHALCPEAFEHAQEAIRLAPENPAAYDAALELAGFNADSAQHEALEDAILRIDPQNEAILANRAARKARLAASNPDLVPAGLTADLHADALAADPGATELRKGLDKATFRLLRGTRWLGLACLAIAGVAIDLFATAKDPELRALPLPLGNRLWALALMGALWGFGAVRRYRALRAGVRLNLRSLLHRDLWSRLVLAQAAGTTLCALAVILVPWTERDVPEVLFWTGLLIPLCSMVYDRRKTR